MNHHVGKVSKILIYPIKSLDEWQRDQATVIPPGTLEWDRRWAMVDANGNYINGKRNAKVHQLRCQFDSNHQTVTLSHQNGTEFNTFQLATQQEAINQWLSEYFQQPVFLQENPEGGFPDDTEAYGPTIISTATLETIASWFEALTVTDLRLRFRANIEIGNVPAFWEDQLFSEPGTVVNFQLGSVFVQGMTPCQRCVVPTRDPKTGESYPHFQKIFTQNREATFPSWATTSRFNHYYRLSINTRISASQIGQMITIGDPVTILNTSPE